MKNINIKARIKRNKLDELAGKSYKDEESEIIKHLNSVNKRALLGIQREDGIYTFIGEDCIYYLTALGVEGEISHGKFLDILKENALKRGKTGEFEFININEENAVWVMNAYTMNAMWNTIMLLYRGR
jgi:hypothetical protein